MSNSLYAIRPPGKSQFTTLIREASIVAAGTEFTLVSETDTHRIYRTTAIPAAPTEQPLSRAQVAQERREQLAQLPHNRKRMRF